MDDDERDLLMTDDHEHERLTIAGSRPVKRIHYADEYLVTGDRIAAALVDYARALAMLGRSDSIDLPGMDRDGVRQRFQILLGPASQMLVSEQQTHEDDIVDDELVLDIEERVTRLQGGPSTAAGSTAAESTSTGSMDDQGDPRIPLDSEEF